MNSSILNFEFALLDSISGLKTEYLDKLMVFFTLLGENGFLWIVLSLVLICFQKTRKIGICVAIALVLDLLLVNITIKPLVARPRPFALKPDIELLINTPKDFSFPSGHSAASFAAAASVFFFNKKWGSVLLGVASVIAFSRLYLYVHYPTDVLGGIICGLLAAIAAYCITIRIKKDAKPKE